MKQHFMYIQCTEKTSGKVGTFVGADNVAISPVFDDIVELFTWMRDNGWVDASYDTGKYVPLAVKKV